MIEQWKLFVQYKPAGYEDYYCCLPLVQLDHWPPASRPTDPADWLHTHTGFDLLRNSCGRLWLLLCNFLSLEHESRGWNEEEEESAGPNRSVSLIPSQTFFCFVCLIDQWPLPLSSIPEKYHGYHSRHLKTNADRIAAYYVDCPFAL